MLIILAKVVILLLIYVLSIEITTKSLSVIPLIISSFLIFCIPQSDSSSVYGVLLVLLSSVALFKYYDKMAANNSQLLGMIPIGVFNGLLAIIRIDMGSYMYGLFFWAAFWAGMADVEGLGLRLINRAIRGFGQGLFYTFIVVLTIIPFVIYCYLQGSIDVEIDAVVAIFANGYGNISLPTPSIEDAFSITYYSPIFVALLSVAQLIYRNRRRTIKANTPLFWKIMLIINLCLNLFNIATLSPDIEHLVPSILFASMLLPLFISTK